MLKVALIVAFSLFAVSVQAQIRTLTVEEAIIRAQDRAPEKLRTESLERQAQAVRQNASRAFDKRPELEVEYITEAPFGERDYELSVGILQEIPVWGVSARRGDVASALEKASVESRNTLNNAIALRTRLLYNRAWSLSQQIELGNRLIATSNKLAAATDKRLSVGDVSRLERNAVVLETNSIRIEHEQVHSNYEQAIGELEALTGLELNDVELTPDRSSTIAIDSFTVNAHQLSPEWIRLRNQTDIARAQLELAKAERSGNPTLGLHYSEDLLTIGDEDIAYDPGASHTIAGITSRGRSAGLSFSMELPITIPGLWGPSNSEVIERETELRLLEADLREFEMQLAGRVARLRPKLSRITRSVGIYQESVDLINENYELLDRGYEGGELSVTELLVGRQQLVELQTRQLELLKEMQEAEIELQSIIGR